MPAEIVINRNKSQTAYACTAVLNSYGCCIESIHLSRSNEPTFAANIAYRESSVSHSSELSYDTYRPNYYQERDINISVSGWLVVRVS